MINSKKTLVSIDEEVLNDLVEQIMLCDDWRYEDIDKVFPINWSKEDMQKLHNEIIDSGLWMDFLHCELRPLIKEKFNHLWDKKN